MTTFGATLWSLALSIGWLIPYRFYPWLSFYPDAWVALLVLTASMWGTWRARGLLACHGATVFAAMLAIIPCLQYGLGQIPQGGVAWTSAAYLLGLLIAIIAGRQWEEIQPEQAADALFLAVGIASFLSVGAQLYQWLYLNGLEFYIMRVDNLRPPGNLGQPNQLGTLLLWGVVSHLWALLRGKVRPKTALLGCAFLLFGVALTKSHAAWIGVAILVVAVLASRRLWPRVWSMPWVAVGLGLWFAACVFYVGWQQQFLNPSAASDDAYLGEYLRINREMRPVIWSALLDALFRSPWVGYGWGQIPWAQMTVATEHPNLMGIYSYSHNQFLDFLLWCGIPLGLLIIGALLFTLGRFILAVKSARDLVLCLFLLIVGNHAMVELPLAFGYFLFPTGLVVGVLLQRLGPAALFQTRKWAAYVLCLLGLSVLVLIVRDYQEVEQSYQTLRLAWLHDRRAPDPPPPKVLLLTQWRDYVKYSWLQPTTNMRAEDIEGLRRVVGNNPNLQLFHKMAMALALNHQPEEAKLWLRRMCKVVDKSQCLLVKDFWATQALKYPEIAATPWPDIQLE